MIQGFNHNIKYKDHIYHIQTEDNGLDHPYIITHVFYGGNILATKKVSYLDIAVNENAPEIIRQMMKDQHKAMVKSLIRGEFDEKIAGKETAAKESDVASGVISPEIDTLDADAATADQRSLDEVILEYLAGEND